MRSFPSFATRGSVVQEKHYKPFSTRTPSLFVFFVVIVLCIALLQNIAEQGTPIGKATTSTSNTTAPRKRDTSTDLACGSGGPSTVCDATQTTSLVASTASTSLVPSSSSTCEGSLPSDCGAIRSPGDGLPEFEVVCGAVLTSNLVSYPIELDTYDDCASACLADSSCTAFGYLVAGSDNECDFPGFCTWTYDDDVQFDNGAASGIDFSQYYGGFVTPANQSNVTDSANTTVSSMPSTSAATSTCATVLPPSDCGSTRSPGEPLPDYEVFCLTYLESPAKVEFVTPYDYDYCASQCLADANCTAFGYWANSTVVEGPSWKVKRSTPSSCSSQNYCWWTYDAVPELWSASLVTSTDPTVYSAGLIISSNSSNSANTTDSTVILAASNSTLVVVSNGTTNSTISSGSSAVSNSSLMISSTTTSVTLSTLAVLTSNSSVDVFSAWTTITSVSSSSSSPFLLITSPVSTQSSTTTTTSSSSVCTNFVAPTDCSDITVLVESTQIEVLCGVAVGNITALGTATSWEDCAMYCLENDVCTAFTLDNYNQTTPQDFSDPCCIGNSSCDPGIYSCYWTADILPTFEVLDSARRSISNQVSGLLISSVNSTEPVNSTTSSSSSTSSTSASSSSGSIFTTISSISTLTTTSSSSSSAPFLNTTVSSTTTSNSGTVLLGVSTSSSSSSSRFSSSGSSTTTPSSLSTSLSSSNLPSTSSSTLSRTTSTLSSSSSLSSTLSRTTSSSSPAIPSSSTLSTTTSSSSPITTSSIPSPTTSSSGSPGFSNTILSTTSSLSFTTLSSTIPSTTSPTKSASSSTTSNSSPSSPSSTFLTTTSASTSASVKSSSASTTSLPSSSAPTINAVSISSSRSTTLLSTTSLAAPTTSSSSPSSASTSSFTSSNTGTTTSVHASSSSLTSTTSLSPSTSSSASVSSSSTALPAIVSSSSSSASTTSSTSSTNSASSTSSASITPSTSNSASASDTASASNSASASNTPATNNISIQSNSTSANLIVGTNAPVTNTNTASTSSRATAAAALASGSSDAGDNKNSQNGNGNGNGTGSGSGGGSSGSQIPATVKGPGNDTQPVPPSTYSGFLSQYVYIIPGEITRFTLFNATFAAVIMSVLFKSFWCWVLAASRMMEPFYQLFRPSGASAEESLLLPYIGAGTAWGSLNPRNKRWIMLLTTCIAFMLSAMAELGSEAMTVRAGSTCTGSTRSGGRTLCDPQWVVNMAILRALQATLGLAAVSIVLLGYLNWPKRSGLAVYPASIASMADMLRHSDDELIQDLRAIDPKATDEEISKSLAGKCYTLTRIGSSSVEGKPLYSIKCTPTAISRRTTALESASKAPISPTKPKSWYKRIPYSHVLHTLLHLILFLIILLFLLDGNDTYIISLTKSSGAGAALVSLPFRFLDGTRFGPRFILSLLCVLLSRYWEEVEVDVRIMSPYRRLWKGEVSGRQLDAMKLHGVPVTMVWHALRAGNWFHATVAGITVSSYALVVLVAGVPYTYGEQDRLNLSSSAASVGILGSMLLGLVGFWVWKRMGPEMVRRPDTLVNVWLLLCGSAVVGERREAAEGDGNEKRQFWYGKGVGTDGVERWMVDTGVRGGKG